MPGPLKALAFALPFQGMVDSPLPLLLGRYDGAADPRAYSLCKSLGGRPGAVGRQELWTTARGAPLP